jgi:hypothetical protein
LVRRRSTPPSRQKRHLGPRERHVVVLRLNRTQIRINEVSSCRHVVMSSCRLVVLSSCRLVVMSSCRHVVILRLSQMQIRIKEVSSYRLVVMSSCRHVVMSSYFVLIKYKLELMKCRLVVMSS